MSKSKFRTVIKNFDGTKYTLEDLQEYIDQSNASEEDIQDLFGGDLLTLPTILQALVDRIKELEAVGPIEV